MIPIHDDNPTRTFAFVTLALIAANAGAFLYELNLPDESVQWFVHRYAFIPAAWTPQAAVTSMFLHGGWLHLIGNMLYLWIFGNNIEDAVGHVKFVFFYLLCGAAAVVAQYLVDPVSTVPMLGASGAVSGVLGAYLLLYPRARVTVVVPIWIFLRFVQVPAVVMLVFWFGMQLLSALLLPPGQTGIAFWAHVGGFVAGLVLILPFKKRRVRLFRG